MHRTDAIATLKSGIRLEYVVAAPDDAKSVKETLVLIHGYPQTCYAYRHVLEPLVHAGLRVVAPSYRGAGNSSADAQTGYDKFTLARDIHELLTTTLALDSFVVLGHDIGSMVATAFAFLPEARKQLRGLIVCECPQPGTSLYRKSTTDPEMILGETFHFAFHQPRGFGEILTEGREDVFLKHFYERLSYNPTFLSDGDLAYYISAFRRAGKMTAGFEVYRSFEQDHREMLEAVKKQGKLPTSLPVLSTGGQESSFTKPLGEAMKELAENVTATGGIPHAGHWIAEENPHGFVKEVLGFLKEQQMV
ncbi:alpha/beta fold hydrolase [Rhodotorula paludigena]|uniref:alpha/beta fold hydrolase n=1 Tax=Rhodotorula paludigena TaxID=86838 RepID=UPI00316FB3CF